MIRRVDEREFDPATLAQGDEVNVLLGTEIRPSWTEKLFGPSQEGEFAIVCPRNFRWPQLLARLGCFPSTSQARKNGWDRDIEGGWSEVTIGKARRIYIYVLKENPDLTRSL
jgi:hypothetical protein